MMRNLVQYRKQAYTKKAAFIYLGTSALKKGHGMCFNLDYLTTTVLETATDPFGARGMKVVERPKNSNNNAFAGVLTQNYPARTSGMQIVELALPGGCAMISQRATSVINQGLLTCVVGEDDSGNITDINGVFGMGGFAGRGSAIPLQTLAVADEGDMPLEEITGVCTSVYDSGTGLTTFTCATGTPGTFMGYVAAAIAASDYEATVWGGATAADSTAERCPSGVYPIVQATGATTFTVTGDTGDGACTVTITKKNLLKLAYLMDGPESGLSAYFLPETGAVITPVIDSGMIIVLGGLTMAADCAPVINDGTMEGMRLGFYQLATLVTKEMLINITSAWTPAGAAIAGTVLSTIEFNTAGEWATLVWHQFGPAGTTYGSWHPNGFSDAGIVPA